MKLFKKLIKGTFQSRHNRFVIICKTGRHRIKAYLPNPGRLLELLSRGSTVYLEKAGKKAGALLYTAVAVEKNGIPIMLHTHKTNDAAEILLKDGLIPGLEGSKIIKREFTYGRSRFDFLIEQRGNKIILEVKSCTLFGKKVAMFPDAVTERGKRHIEELADISKGDMKGAVLFMIHSPLVDYFLPEYHTDIEFSKSLISAKDRIKIIPFSMEWRKDLSPDLSKGRILPVPWEIVEKEADDAGCYLLVLKVLKDTFIGVGSIGNIFFRKGYYIYAGSARKNLDKRIQRHKNLRKKLFWHIDYLRKFSAYHASFPIRTSDDIECLLAKSVRGIADFEITGFGCSDCSCKSHLFRMKNDPLISERFIELVQYYRMDRLFK